MAESEQVETPAAVELKLIPSMNHRSDYPRNRPYGESKYSHYRPSYSQRGYGRERSDLLVQVSGPDRDLKGDPRTIARACFQCPRLLDANQQLRLILGIKANGASELLAPKQLATHLLYDVKRLASAEDDNLKFKSLSPIVFHDVSGLEDILADHMNGKKGRRSKANKVYEGFNVNSVSKDSPRYYYENLRTILRHMTFSLPYTDALYGISTPPNGRMIFSEFLLFTCNDYKLGRAEGFLDAAWGYVDCDVLKAKSTDLGRIKPHMEQDIYLKDEMFSVGKLRTPCRHVETIEVAGLEDSRITFRQHLQACYKRDLGPVCVVVHDWKKSKMALQVMGVDTGSWSTSLQSAMRGASSVLDRKPKRDRSRSRSPTARGRAESSRHVKQESERGDRYPVTKHGTSSPRGVDSRELDVYVVDTQALYSTVRKSGNLATGLLAACADFELPVDEVAQNEYSAGNEIQYLWDLFIKMADGATIDEMYRTQFNDRLASRRAGEDDEEEEEDGPLQTSSSTRVPSGNPFDDLFNDNCDDDSD